MIFHERIMLFKGFSAWCFIVALWCLLICEIGGNLGVSPVVKVEPPTHSSKPNVIIFFVDDLGYGDLGISGHPTSRTPNIDALAADSRIFTHFYVASPVCSPSRAALLTGRYQVRSGTYPGVYFPPSVLGLPHNETTIAKLLKQQGYKTQIVGKWHLGVGYRNEFLPSNPAYGFDNYLGIPYSHDMCPCEICFPNNGSCLETCWDNLVSCPLYHNKNIIEQPVDLTTLSHRLVSRAVKFIYEANMAKSPFFLYYPFHHIHRPQFSSPTFSGKNDRGATGDALLELDWAVGTVMKTLKDMDLLDDTLIWFTSDNGPSMQRHESGGSAGLLRCGKGTTWEGGVRVPGFVHWPSKIPPGKSNAVASAIDILPTISSIVGIDTSNLTLDGVDISEVLFDSSAKTPRNFFAVYPEFPDQDTGPFAIIHNQYKAHFYTKGSDLSDPDNYDPMCLNSNVTRHDPPLLFNLHKDPGERYDLGNKEEYRQNMASSKSIVWRFCTIKEDDKSKVLCNICKESISRGGKTSVTYNTTNIKKHLYMKHKKEVENEEKLMNEEIEKTKKKRKIGQSGDDGAEAGTSRTNIQLTMEQTFELKTKWAIDSQDAKSLHKYIGEMIAIDNQPYSIVEDEGFQRFVGKACPKYEIPSRKYFSQTVVPDIYKKVRNKLQIIVDGCESISFTSDIWTASASNTAFISLTGHCLSKTFEQQVGVLRVAHFPESHTGSNISEIILNCIEEFNIPIYKVHLIVRDNGPNMVKGINDSGISSLSCVLHTMQLIIKDSIFNQKIVKDTIAICRSIVTHFNHSPQASAKLKELQQKLGSPEKKLVQDVPTRWNSTFLMFQRMLEQKAPVGTYCLDVQGLPNLDSNKWNVIAKLVEILGIFYETTVRLSDRTCTAADIIPNIRYIKMFLDKAEKKVNAGSSLAGLGSTIISLKGSTDKRFERYMKDTNVILATFLDPRYKNNLFEDEEHQMTCKENLVSIMAKTIETLQRDEESETGSASEKSSEPGDAELETFDFDKCFNEIVKKSVSGDKHERPSESSEPTPDKESVAKRIPSPKKAKLIDAVNSEVDRYLAMKRIERKENPLEWWNSNKLLFKYLTFLAKKFLSPPPSSVESERLFSTGGQIYSPRRNRLNPETGEQLMFLNFNLKIFNFEY